MEVQSASLGHLLRLWICASARPKHNRNSAWDVIDPNRQSQVGRSRQYL